MPQNGWQPGDIAFLKHYDTYSPQDYADLITSGHLQKDATVHPVILLAVANHRAIVTPVSAFRTEAQGGLPPWAQPWHRHKPQAHFRAFAGTARPPGNPHAPLRLADPAAMAMPKPRASWVYLRSFYCVPLAVLGAFARAPVLLRVHPASLRRLARDIRTAFPREHREAGRRLRAAPGPGPAPAPAPAPATPAANAPASWARVAAAQQPPAAAPRRNKTYATSTSTAAGTLPAAIRPERLCTQLLGIRIAS